MATISAFSPYMCTMLEFMQKQDIRGAACFILACDRSTLPDVPNVTCIRVGTGCVLPCLAPLLPKQL